MKLFIWFKHAGSFILLYLTIHLSLILFASLCVDKQDLSLSDANLCATNPMQSIMEVFGEVSLGRKHEKC